jgi:hypothetical protein
MRPSLPAVGAVCRGLCAASNSGERYPPGDDARTAGNRVVNIGACSGARRAIEHLAQHRAFQRKPPRARVVEKHAVSDRIDPVSPVQRLAIRMGTDLVGKGRAALLGEKVRKLGTLVADASADLLDRQVRRTDQPDRSAHHAPVGLTPARRTLLARRGQATCVTDWSNLAKSSSARAVVIRKSYGSSVSSGATKPCLAERITIARAAPRRVCAR